MLEENWLLHENDLRDNPKKAFYMGAYIAVNLIVRNSDGGVIKNEIENENENENEIATLIIKKSKELFDS